MRNSMTDLDNVKVSATIIVISRDNKALIVQRPSDKTFPNLWTVAGGKMQEEDGNLRSKGFRYNSVENCARRELYEETGIGTDLVWTNKLKYFCSITTTWSDMKRVILSFYVVVDKNARNVKITLKENQAYLWIKESDIDKHSFIPDIGGEIREVFRILSEKRQAEFDRILES